MEVNTFGITIWYKRFLTYINSAWSFSCYSKTMGVDIHQKQIRIPETNTATQLFLFDCSGKDVYRGLVQSMVGIISTHFLPNNKLSLRNLLIF